jgi:hypothetical protein
MPAFAGMTIVHGWRFDASTSWRPIQPPSARPFDRMTSSFGVALFGRGERARLRAAPGRCGCQDFRLPSRVFQAPARKPAVCPERGATRARS